MEDKKEIRFINSHYQELFRINDGESIEIRYPKGEIIERECFYLDEYHTKIGQNVYHICDFAERMEKMGAEYRPVKEPLYKSRTDAYAGRTQPSPSSRRGR